MNSVVASLLLLLLPAALHAQEGEEAPAAPEAAPAIDLPSAVLPHCLYGFDPHDQAVRPWPKGPVPEGYLLNPSSKLHLLALVGFEAEDVVVSVNGYPVGTAERHYEARRAVQGTFDCAWEVRRGDATHTLRATIHPGGEPPLVLDRNKDGEATKLSRIALWARLSNPYAFGRYPSMLAMAADDGVYAIDKGLVALMRDLDFEQLDHHREIAGVALRGGRDVLAALELTLTEAKVRWKYSRRGEARTRVFVLEGDVIEIEDRADVAEPKELELPED